MKTSLGLAACAAMALACGPAQAALFTFTTTMTGLQENPPNLSPGMGTAFVGLDPAANRLEVRAEFSGLMSPTTMAHIHCCIAPPGNVGVAVPAGSSLPGFPLGVTAGSYSAIFDTAAAATWRPAFVAANGGTTEGAEAALLAALRDGTAYFNVHTAMFPGGEIRGFFAAVPVPMSLGLLLAGMAGLAAVRTGRRAA